MKCSDSESLILAERDGVLTKDQLAALSDHVAACPTCRQFQATLHTALDSLKAGINAVTVPDAGEAWHELQMKLHQPEARTSRKRPVAPVIWFSAPLAAAAAIAFAFFLTRPSTPAPSLEVAVVLPPLHDPSLIAGADFVEPGDPNATTLVYVDKDSGWLVVWATDGDAKTSG